MNAKRHADRSRELQRQRNEQPQKALDEAKRKRQGQAHDSKNAPPFDDAEADTQPDAIKPPPVKKS